MKKMREKKGKRLEWRRNEKSGEEKEKKGEKSREKERKGKVKEIKREVKGSGERCEWCDVMKWDGEMECKVVWCHAIKNTQHTQHT